MSSWLVLRFLLPLVVGVGVVLAHVQSSVHDEGEEGVIAIIIEFLVE